MDVFTPLWAEDHLAGAGVCLQARSGDVKTVLVTAQMECVFILRGVVSRKHLSKGKTKFQ